MHSETKRSAQLAWEAILTAVTTQADSGVRALSKALHAGLAPWVEAAGTIEIRRVGPFLLINGGRVGGVPAERLQRRHAVELLRSAGLDGVRIKRGVSAAEFEAWVELAAEPALAHHAAGGVVVQLRTTGVSHIEAIASVPQQRRGTLLLPAHRQQAFGAYVAALQAQRSFAASLTSGEPASMHALRRSVHRLMDTMLEDDTALIGLSALRSVRLAGETTMASHPANVAVLSLALGRAGGLQRTELVTLGVAALLHDVGAHPVVDDPASQKDSLASHAIRGAAQLVRSGTLDVVGTAALVAIEHHVQAGRHSAPPMPANWENDTATRIVQIADAYDRLSDFDESGVTPKNGGREALAVMQRQAGFDSHWLARFVRLLGAYPPATVVRLQSDAVGVVVRANRDPQAFEQPVVRLLLDPTGQPYTGEPTVDLAAPDAPRVRATVGAQSAGIDPVGLFLP